MASSQLLPADDEAALLRATLRSLLDREGRVTDIIGTFFNDKTVNLNAAPDRDLLNLQISIRKEIRDDIDVTKALLSSLTSKPEHGSAIGQGSSGGQRPGKSTLKPAGGADGWTTVSQGPGASKRHPQSATSPTPTGNRFSALPVEADLSTPEGAYRPRKDKRLRDSPISNSGKKAKFTHGRANLSLGAPKGRNQAKRPNPSGVHSRPSTAQSAAPAPSAMGRVLIIRGALAKLPEGVDSGEARASFIIREVKNSFPNERLKTIRPVGRDDILVIPTNQESVARMQQRENWKSDAFNKADFSVFLRGSRPSQPKADPVNTTRVLHIPEDLFTADEIKAALNKDVVQVASAFRVRSLATGRLTDVVRVVFNTLDFAKAADTNPATLHGMGPFKFALPHRTTPLKRCFKCSDFGHFAAVCTKAPMCFRCAGPHELRTCPHEQGSTTKCGFCQQAHPAGTGDCPRRVAALLEAKAAAPKFSSLQRESQLILNSVQAQLATSSTSSKSYAQVTAKSTALSTFQELIGPIQAELAKLGRVVSGLIKLFQASNPQMAIMLKEIASPMSPASGSSFNAE